MWEAYLVIAVGLGVLGAWYHWPVFSSPFYIPSCMALALIGAVAMAFLT